MIVQDNTHIAQSNDIHVNNVNALGYLLPHFDVKLVIRDVPLFFSFCETEISILSEPNQELIDSIIVSLLRYLASSRVNIFVVFADCMFVLLLTWLCVAFWYQISPRQSKERSIQREVIVLDSQLSPVLLRDDASYVDVVDWFSHVILDSMQLLLMAYHQE